MSLRQEWMALLARAPLPLLEQALQAHLGKAPQWLRRPETGLMMVQGRTGGHGERFNLGEVTVTRCALRLNAASPSSPVGVAYVLGRNHKQAWLAATADALLQVPASHEELAKTLLTPVRAFLAEQAAAPQQRTSATRVDFLTMAREVAGQEDEVAA